MQRIVTAFFRDRAAARAAEEVLLEMGVPADRIGLHAEAPPVEPASAHAPGNEPGLPGILDALFLPGIDFAAHREAVRRGGSVVAVEVTEAQAAAVARALDAAGAEDLDAHEADWRREGWTPAEPRDPARQARREPAPGRARSYVIGT